MKKILLLISIGLFAMSASFAQIRTAGQIENFELKNKIEIELNKLKS